MGTWFAAQQQGAQVVRDQTTRKRSMAEEDRTIAKDIVDRQRKQAQEDRDITYNQEIRRQELAELQRLRDLRDAKTSRNPTEVEGFKYAGQGQGQVVGQVPTAGVGQGQGQGQGQVPTAGAGQVPTAGAGQVPVAGQGQIPIFDTSGQNDLATRRDAALLQGNKDYDTALTTESQRLGGVGTARDKLLALQAAEKGKGYEQYLPVFEDVASEKSLDYARSGFEQDMVDTPQVQKAQSFVSGVESFLEQGKGSGSGTGSNWANIALNYFGLTSGSSADQKKVLQENRDMEDFFSTYIVGSSDAEKWFATYPGEMEKVFGGVTDSKTQRENLFKYYQEVVKPMLADGEADGDINRANYSTSVESIAKAKTTHKDYLSKIATGINTLDDDLANAPEFLKVLNKDRLTAQNKLQKLYDTGITANNAAQIAKLESVAIDKSLLDPTQLDGLVRQSYEQRQLLMYKAKNARKVAEISGDWTEYDKLRAEMGEKDVSIYEAIGHQGISDLTMNNDPRRISAVLSEFANSKIIVQPRSDGMYNLISNGKLSGEPKTANDIGALVQMYSSPTYRAQAAANAQKQVEQQLEGASTQQSTAQNTSETIRALLTEKLKGINAKDKVEFEQQFKNQEWKFSSIGDGNGGGFLTTPAGDTVLYNPMPGVSASGKPLSQFMDISSQLGKDTSFRINSGTMDFNNSAFWKSIGLPNPLNK